MKPTYLLLALVPLALTHPTSPQPLEYPPGHNSKLCHTILTAITHLESGQKTPENVWVKMAKAFAVIEREHKCPAGTDDDDNEDLSRKDCRVKELIESEIKMLLTMEKFEHLRDKMAEALVRFGFSLGCIHPAS